jgi:hypothetical protein
MKNFLQVICLVTILLKTNFIVAQVSQPFAVVELFTSEGCSSCPPAEKLLNRISSEAKTNQKNIFCLEYHVDYWDRAGWKDPFSKNQFTRRQNNYSGALQHKELYTPQMIVNGETEFVGFDAGKANAAIDKALKIPVGIRLSITVDSVSNDSAYVHYSSSQSDKNFSLHFVVVENGLTSKISKGENSGKTLTHDNMVRIFYSTGLNTNSGSVIIPLKGFSLNQKCSMISFAQHKQSMKILGVAKNNFDAFLKAAKE